MNCRPHPYQGCALPTELPGPKPLRARSRFEVRGCFPSALGLWLSAPYALERVMGIEPTPSAWKAEVLPLNYTRIITNGGVPTGTTALGAAGPRTAAHAPAFSGAARLRRTPVRFASSPERVRRRPCIHLVEGGGLLHASGVTPFGPPRTHGVLRRCAPSSNLCPVRILPRTRPQEALYPLGGGGRIRTSEG